MQKSVWKENWEIGTVVVWKEFEDFAFARVYTPIDSNKLDEVIELITNIHFFRTKSRPKTGRDLREGRINTLENMVRLGQIARQLEPVSINSTDVA